MSRSPSPTFRILHISDLHRDANSNFNPQLLVEGLQRDLNEIQTGPHLVDAIIFSGDAVDRGDSDAEYAQSRDFLLELYKCLFPDLSAKKDHSRLVIVPGNHDIDWTICKAAIRPAPHKADYENEEHIWVPIERGDKWYFERSLYRQKLKNFAELFSACVQKNWPEDFGQQILDYRLLEPNQQASEPGVVAIGINTAYRVHHASNQAGLDASAVGHAMKLLREKYCPERWIRILVQHHPYRTYRDGPLDQVFYETAAGFLREFSLVLHGHVHEHMPQSAHQLGGGQIPIIGAGTLFAGKNLRPDVVGHEYNIVVLDLKKRSIQVIPRQRDHSGAPWRSDNRWTPGGANYYELPLRSPTVIDEFPQPQDLPPAKLDFIEASVERTKLFAPFFDYAVKRDVVFALGGVGGGLDTFLEQFHLYLERDGARSFSTVDFDPNAYVDMRNARLAWVQALEPLGHLGLDRLDLKCLFAALAYEVCHILRGEYPDQIDRVIGVRSLVDRAHFLEYFFTHSDAMKGAEMPEIVRYFFETLQELAEATADKGVIVFMPMKRLASCFKSGGDRALWQLAYELWGALGSFVGPTDKFDKVCLIVGASEYPYGHKAFKKAVVARSLWYLPPLDVEETQRLLDLVCPTLSGSNVAEILMTATGGSPMITRLVLSFLRSLVADRPIAAEHTAAENLVNRSIDLVKNAIATGGKSVDGPLREVIGRYLTSVSENLGNGAATDSGIEAAWAGPLNERRRGYNIESPRVEAFVASGLVWLDGDPWDKDAENYIFRRYPHLRFRPPSDVAIAVYEHVTGRKISS